MDIYTPTENTDNWFTYFTYFTAEKDGDFPRQADRRRAKIKSVLMRYLKRRCRIAAK